MPQLPWRQIPTTAPGQWRASFKSNGEIGASIAATVNGVPVIEAWGGFSDTLETNPKIPWNRDTVSRVFSGTKGATALCAHMLVAQGLLDQGKTVAYYWPELAQNGKATITVRMLLV
jgi:CubicO group peptidase (beta-lactamase class C family)